MEFPKFQNELDRLNAFGYDFKPIKETTILSSKIRENIDNLRIGKIAIKVEDCYNSSTIIGVYDFKPEAIKRKPSEFKLSKRMFSILLANNILHLTVGKHSTLISNNPAKAKIDLLVDLEVNKLTYETVYIEAENPDVSYEIIGVEFNY